MLDTSEKPQLRLLLDHFALVKDDRELWRVVHPLCEVLLLVVCGTIAAGNDFEDIADWSEDNRAFLRRFLPYLHEIPGARCQRMLMNRIAPDLFADCFGAWAAAVRPAAPELVAVDGKTSRGSHNRTMPTLCGPRLPSLKHAGRAACGPLRAGRSGYEARRLAVGPGLVGSGADVPAAGSTACIAEGEGFAAGAVAGRDARDGEAETGMEWNSAAEAAAPTPGAVLQLPLVVPNAGHFAEVRGRHAGELAEGLVEGADRAEAAVHGDGEHIRVGFHQKRLRIA